MVRSNANAAFSCNAGSATATTDVAVAATLEVDEEEEEEEELAADTPEVPAGSAGAGEEEGGSLRNSSRSRDALRTQGNSPWNSKRISWEVPSMHIAICCLHDVLSRDI